MQWLVDSDVIIKLAEFDLLDEFLTVLDTKRANLFRLEELPRVLRGRKIFVNHTRDAVDRALKFIQPIPVITQVDFQELKILVNSRAAYQNRVEQIDTGEQTLIMGTKFIEDSVIITHDKKALRVLANDPACKVIYERIKGRVYCLEQIVE